MHVFLVVLHIFIVHVILCNYAHTHIARKQSDGLVLGGGGGGGHIREGLIYRRQLMHV
jgi:hypothetical protein